MILSGCDLNTNDILFCVKRFAHWDRIQVIDLSNNDIGDYAAAAVAYSAANFCSNLGSFDISNTGADKLSIEGVIYLLQ